MKIRNRLIITIATFLSILIIISLSITTTQQQAANLNNYQSITGNIENRISHLNYIADNYLLTQQPSQLAAWQSNTTALYGDISQLTSTNINQNQIAATLWADVKIANDTFLATVDYLEATPMNATVRNNPQFQAAWSQLSSALQALSSQSTQLSQSLHNQTDAVNQSNTYLIIILLIAFALYLLASYLIMFRYTLRTISVLHRGLKAIGKGNFDQEVKTGRSDELGELSDSLNTMRLQLKANTEQLAKQERLAGIGQTAGMVGHDIRNPLQSISGELYLLNGSMEDLPDSNTKNEMKESIDSITANISYINKIVADLQDYARPIMPEYSTVDLSNVLVKVFENIKVPDAIKLSMKINDLEQLQTDPTLLQRALSNLTTNAIQAMPQGGILEIAAKRENGKAVITVSDTGAGIPEEIKPKLFTPMMTTKAKGQGFGLAVTKRLIESMKGTIAFESEMGKGTKFTIELPTK